MKSIFKPEDFQHLGTYTLQDLADIGNNKLAKLIESSLTVYGTVTDNGFMGSHPYLTGPLSKDTHSAKLMFIEELSKKDCKHEPIITSGIVSFVPKCKYCGIELQATWSEKK